ncbi:methionyl-tRNA formyltransferase [Paracoccus sp. R12_1]|uniref:methionyl-tRNA formyltransferase n=1 Tax=unclassified Paracoccus (in: a-proteobacteria) TaxID=2688777 RepID=UPI001ADC43DF|nr:MULTISPECIES: methionyl-tRNA formyltransferase [unclassified Paracoccus (in: a-proteobacteria)]MBO9456496.1 methionyl-tRNA formyltransferase [Paracoccus sp. R12_2]MBO9487653.1 methionyl-tRNA formyltransferase [Paracoccus sp. R12_1]
MRVIFMGTPEFSVPALRAVAAAHDVVAVYSQPPRAAGRGQKPRPSPVHRAAEALGIEVRTPLKLREPVEQAGFADLGADVAVVVAYGLILPQPVLDAPRLGCLNIHASLLPRWRGAAPIHRAVIAGDAETGVAIMQMQAGLDTGPVLSEARTEIGAEEITGDLHDRLSAMGADLIADVLSRLPLPAVAQSEDGVTYASKIDKAEARIDWAQPAAEVDRKIRGLSPFPGAWCEISGERVKLLRSRLAPGAGAPGDVLGGFRVACSDGAVEITQAQRQGKRPMSADELLRGLILPAQLG